MVVEMDGSYGWWNGWFEGGALKIESCHYVSFVATCNNAGCLYDNLRCHQRGQIDIMRTASFNSSWLTLDLATLINLATSLNLATELTNIGPGPQNIGFEALVVKLTWLEQRHEFPYILKTRQHELNKASLPNMTSLRFPTPRKAHQKMAVFN